MWSATSGTRRFYDAIVENSEPRANGRCLCGAVTYEVRGPSPAKNHEIAKAMASVEKRRLRCVAMAALREEVRAN